MALVSTKQPACKHACKEAELQVSEMGKGFLIGRCGGDYKWVWVMGVSGGLQVSGNGEYTGVGIFVSS